MNLSFKKCSIEDLDVLMKISKETFVEAFQSQNNPEDFKRYIEEAFSKKSVKQQLLNSDSHFYFTYLNNALVGYFKLNENKAQNEPFKNAIELERIYVIKDFQGQKIGKDMLEKAISISKSKKGDFLWLGVWEHNTSAIRFYERYDFKKFDEHSFYLGKDQQTDWLMKLNFV